MCSAISLSKSSPLLRRQWYPKTLKPRATITPIIYFIYHQRQQVSLYTPVTILKYYSLFSLHCPTHVRQTRIAKDKTWCKGIEEFWSWLNHQERWPPYKVWELSSLYYPVVGVVCSRVISLFRLLPSNNWSFINLWSPVFIWIFLKFNLNQEQTGQNVAHHSRRFLLGMIFSYCIFCWRIMQGCLQSDLV